MKIPGFTAEASLYKASRCYGMAGAVIRVGDYIYPAQDISEFVHFEESILSWCAKHAKWKCVYWYPQGDLQICGAWEFFPCG